MRRVRMVGVVAATLGLLAGGMGMTSEGAAPAAVPRSQPEPAPAPVADPGPLDVYTVRLDERSFGVLQAAGVDTGHLVPVAGPDGATTVEVALTDALAQDLANQGVTADLVLVEGMTSSQRATAVAADGHTVFRPYSGTGGLQAEFEQLATDNPGIAKLVTIGRTHQGRNIVALKVTRRARTTRDGRRPATLYAAAQHAREWIAPEMVRRLAHHVVDGYGRDAALTDLVDSTELWFVPVANPDGYDFTFTPGNRNWRKNLRDNNGDGRITSGDGVDLNRNFATKWGYDEEGSSALPGSETYRGPSPGSEPETRAFDGLVDRVGFEFVLNYHSPLEGLFYGTAWQASTPTPDDVVYEAIAGDDAHSAVPGYDPDLIADMALANGETTEHAHNAHGSLAFTPEMSACQTASAADPNDAFDPAGCSSLFDFPDDEALVAAEFAKNVPFALAAARSAPDPDNPVSPVGRTTPEFVVDSFDVSYGDPQTVAVTARRDQRQRRLNYRVNGGPTRRARVDEWEGGERYGGESDIYYAEFRGEVTGTRTGDSVEVWFTSGTGARTVESDHFTYTVAADTGADALIIANEDYTGVNPTYPPGTAAPRHADDYEAALDANGVSHLTWDVDARGVPHPLGVLAHFGAVVWDSGDDRLPQAPEDQFTSTFLFGPLPDAAVTERQHVLTLAVRDYLNEGGKLLQAGETSQYQGVIGRSLGGVYYGLDGAIDRPCAITRDFIADCGILPDDFAQYYLGAMERATSSRPAGFEGTGPLAGVSGTFGGEAVAGNPLNEAGAFTLTSDLLPADRFPLFAGEASSRYTGATTPNPFGPVQGDRYAAALHADASYQRLGRTVDLTGVAAAEAPTLRMKLSFSTLAGLHHVIVEAAPSGTDEWTTLRDLGGRSSPAPPSQCGVDGYLELHPFLSHYLTRVGGQCTPTGTTGAWNAFTNESNTWVDTAFDLSGYAGRAVDVKVSYVSDGNVGARSGVGVFVDDTRVTTGAGTLDADGFEEGETRLWAVEGPPPGGPPANQGDFAVTTELLPVASSVTTEDTVLLGFGLESLAAPEDRAALLGRIMDHLLS